MNSPNGEEGGEYDPNNVLGGAQKRFADEYQTGGYIMLAPAIVTKNIERDSEALSTQLKPSQKINIVQIKQLEDRIRGQLKSGGWISIAHVSVENWVWAEMIDKPSKPKRTMVPTAPKPYLGIVQHDKKRYPAAIFPKPKGDSCNVVIMESEPANINNMTGKHLIDISTDQVTKVDKATFFSDDDEASNMDLHKAQFFSRNCSVVIRNLSVDQSLNGKNATVKRHLKTGEILIQMNDETREKIRIQPWNLELA